MLGAQQVTAPQEALWYALYGALLGVVGLTVWQTLPPQSAAPRRTLEAVN